MERFFVVADAVTSVLRIVQLVLVAGLLYHTTIFVARITSLYLAH